MRCLTLAHELNNDGWDCTFSCNPEARELIPALKSDFPFISPEDLGTEVDLLVVDHYSLDKQYEYQCRKWARKILVLDDLADREHDCDILLDQTFGREANDYQLLTPSNCKILAGTKYALLREQFVDYVPVSLKRRANSSSGIKRVLVSLGTMNIFNITTKALQALELHQESALQIYVILGAKASFLNEVKTQIKAINAAGFHKVELHINVENMAEMMANADIAIGAGGTTSWERCALGLPTINIMLANNQQKISQELDKAGAIINMGWHDDVTPKDIAETLTLLNQTPDKLRQISMRASQICDSSGANRLIMEIERAYI